jgi:hypothetical protein
LTIIPSNFYFVLFGTLFFDLIMSYAGISRNNKWWVEPIGFFLAAMVTPATIDHIRAVSLHQERMPAKSTYFYPKLVSGLVVHSLE